MEPPNKLMIMQALACFHHYSMILNGLMRIFLKGETVSGTVFFLPGGIEGRTLAARRPLSAVRGLVRRAALVQEPTGRSTTLAHQIQNSFPGETHIDARHVQR